MRAGDRERIRRAVAESELVTSAEIVVSIAPLLWGKVERAAELAVARLGVERTRHRNGVLLFVAPWRHQFVIHGDEGIHQRVGQRFWDDLVPAVSATLGRTADLASGIIDAVHIIGRRLGAHFPHDPAMTLNELPDEPRY